MLGTHGSHLHPGPLADSVLSKSLRERDSLLLRPLSQPQEKGALSFFDFGKWIFFLFLFVCFVFNLQMGHHLLLGHAELSTSQVLVKRG